MLGEKIRQARKDAGIEQAELAQILGFSQSALSRWEKGNRDCHIDTIKEIARITGKTLAWFLEEDLKDGDPAHQRSGASDQHPLIGSETGISLIENAQDIRGAMHEMMRLHKLQLDTMNMQTQIMLTIQAELKEIGRQLSSVGVIHQRFESIEECIKEAVRTAERNEHISKAHYLIGINALQTEDPL